MRRRRAAAMLPVAMPAQQQQQPATPRSPSSPGKRDAEKQRRWLSSDPGFMLEYHKQAIERTINLRSGKHYPDFSRQYLGVLAKNEQPQQQKQPDVDQQTCFQSSSLALCARHITKQKRPIRTRRSKTAILPSTSSKQETLALTSAVEVTGSQVVATPDGSPQCTDMEAENSDREARKSNRAHLRHDSAPTRHNSPPVIVDRDSQVREREPLNSSRTPKRSKRAALRYDKDLQLSDRTPQNSERTPRRSNRGPKRSDRALMRYDSAPLVNERAPMRNDRASQSSERVTPGRYWLSRTSVSTSRLYSP